MKIIGIQRDTIEDFKSSWQCHGISDDVDFIVVAFDDDGDLVDYDCEDADHNPIEAGIDSGEALAVLMGDAFKYHDVRSTPNTIGPVRIANIPYPLEANNAIKF